FSQLTAVAVAFARRHGIDELLAAVHPRHARFYSRIMGFRCLSDAVPYAGVLNHPAVLIAVSINQLERVDARWQEWYSPWARFPPEALSRRAMTPKEVVHFSSYVNDFTEERAA
ncbi:MAG TPA: hypothetical protein DDZ51_25190, partial [Planctomycetaceae bacterium]|nr:hypothetical protein [Planctomycetaceae bacterium]